MPDSSSVMPLAWSLGAYFVLQLLLNARLRMTSQSGTGKRSILLRAALANATVNSLFFILVSCYLVISGSVQQPQVPPHWWIWLLGSLPAGLVLWGLRIRLVGLGRRLFGSSAFVEPAEVVLRSPANLQELNRAALQISLLQPLGNELFFRACFLALTMELYGTWAALLATAVIELLLRLNPAWAISVVASSLILSGISIAGGGPLASICTAICAGFLHAYVTAYQALRASGPAESE